MEQLVNIFKKRKEKVNNKFINNNKLKFNRNNNNSNNKNNNNNNRFSFFHKMINNSNKNVKDFVINENNLLMKDMDNLADDLENDFMFIDKSGGLNESSSSSFKDKEKKTPILVLVYLYFVVIASVLGTGILALPVKLSESGFTPFLASYTLCYLMQLVSVFYLIEVLQRIYSIIKSNSIINSSTTLQNFLKESSNEISMEPLSDSSIMSNNEYLKDSTGSSIKSSPPNEPLEFETTTSTTQSKGDISDSTSSLHRGNDSLLRVDEEGEGVQKHDSHSLETPNLHSIGAKFLGSFAYYIFIFSVILHFCSTLISYGLAGSEAYAQVLGVNHSYIILPVVVVLSLIVVFGSNALQHIITFFTFGKGTLLVIIVFITGIISNQIDNPIVNNWTYIGKSFLISTVALGGSASVVPLVFPKIVFSKKEMFKCYMVVGLSLTTVYILNIIWCWFLLRIIPQLPDPSNPSLPSLFEAANQGQIATIPLMNVVKLTYPAFLWIAKIIDIFIVISITISFITVGNGFKHILDGFIYSWRSKSLNSTHHDENTLNIITGNNEDYHLTVDDERLSSKFAQKLQYKKYYSAIQLKASEIMNRINQIINQKEGQSTMDQSMMTVRIPIREIIFYTVFFGFILLICLVNPKGFLMVLEGGTSLGLNLQAGTFVVMMLNFSRKNYENFSIPLPVNEFLFKLRYIIFFYFTFAVFYDIYLILLT